MIRVGIPASFNRFFAVANAINAPVLVSANAFWRKGRFNLSTPETFSNIDVALDSAGFVAMHLYWGYRWTLGDYVDFAGLMKPTWWAAPDYCCEPEIARDSKEVLDRVHRTAFKLDWARQVAADRGVKPPMPVLRGWHPEDYLRCADLIPELPSLVGVGSVCRRSLNGGAGIINVIFKLDANLPRHVKLHLFGVKGPAIKALRGHPRIASVDSAAWDYQARREKTENGVTSCTIEYRSYYLCKWYKQQRMALGPFRQGRDVF